MKLDIEEVKALENDIDKHFESVSSPSNKYSLSVWYLVTVLEDKSRFILDTIFEIAAEIGIESEEISSRLHKYLIEIDRFKYHLKYALFHQRKYNSPSFKEKIDIPKDIEGKKYTKALDLLTASDKFTKASQCFSTYYSGYTTAFKSPEGTIGFKYKNEKETAYDVLEYTGIELLFSQPEGAQLLNLVELLYLMWGHAEKTSELGGRIAFTSKVTKTPTGLDTIVSNYDKELGAELLEHIQFKQKLIPENWMFPWGNVNDCVSIFNAICARCLYHLVAINLAANLSTQSGYTVEGHGVENICLTLEKDVLINQLTHLTKLPEEDISKFINAITLGNKTTHPDPALQYIIPISETQLILPCSFIISSNIIRNMLSLHARLDKSSFDNNSSVFEERMVSKTKNIVKDNFKHFEFNFHLPNNREVGEIDLAIADLNTKTILIGELRWVLQPGDPNEVIQKRIACIQKIDQIEPKVKASKKGLEELLGLLNINNEYPNEWEVCGLVIISNFSGAYTTKEEIPIVPLSIFNKKLSTSKSLKSFHSELVLHKWLPKEGKHFSISYDKVTFGQSSFLALSYSAKTELISYATNLTN